MRNPQKGNSLIIAAVVGAVAAALVIFAYKAISRLDANTGMTPPPSESGIVERNDNAIDAPAGGTATTTDAVEDMDDLDLSPKAESDLKSDTESNTKTDPGLDLESDGGTNNGAETSINDGAQAEKTTIDTRATESLEAARPVEFVSYATAADASNAVEASNKFALELYSQYKGEAEKNVFFSPYSIFSGLGMAYEGARGTTSEGIRSVFHFATDNATRIGSFANLYSQINTHNSTYELAAANALWAQKDYPFAPGYAKTVSTYYGGKTTNVDFISDAEGARKTINNWVNIRTSGKIPNLFSAGSLNKNTHLVLTNAIYFKGKWAIEFDTGLTREKDFHTASGKKIQTETMKRQARFFYVGTDNYQAVEIPYENDDLSMIIILPEPDKIAAVENQLDPVSLASMRKSMSYELVELSMPKFKFDTSYNLNSILSKMGMSRAFDPNRADFTGMYDRAAADGDNLYLGLVIHKAYVDVDEKGTEAAAATGLATFGATSTANSQDPIVFNADQPFIFAITHNSTGTILFLGKVNDPTL